MVLLETALLFLGVILIAGGCGFGIVCLLLPDEYRDEFGFVLMPVVGYCFYSWVAFNLSGTFQIPGYDVTVATASVMALLGLLALLRRPPTRAMVKGMWPTLPLCLGGVCLALWPLFVVGAETYLGAVNPDYTATLFD